MSQAYSQLESGQLSMSYWICLFVHALYVIVTDVLNCAIAPIYAVYLFQATCSSL